MIFLGLCLWISTEIASPDDSPAAGVAERLRHSTVHVARGAEGVVDADRARRLVADRPIVVIGVTEDPPYTCDEVADGLPGLIVLEVSTEDDWPFSVCGDHGLEYGAWHSLREAGIGDDRTSYVEEYVWQFDALGAGDKATRRVPAPEIDEVPVHKLVFTALFLAALTWFVCEFAYVWYRRRLFWAGHDRTWKADLNARLNRVADTLLRSDSLGTAAERAAAGKRYVLLLRNFEKAEKPADLGPIGRELTALEEITGVSRRRRRRSRPRR